MMKNGTDMKMKNLIIRGDRGRVVDFKEGLGHKVDDYKWLEAHGFTVEATDLHYTKKWDKWWEDYS